ncbi:MAG: MurR/RpiR family transcriptional regulator [Clostridiales bacterium]|jgi:DNA-binding MurR/RpiR family transcriptional regulator|nr:MurR/RpiR family transcriptional regulator [Clostridiales bacterium]
MGVCMQRDLLKTIEQKISFLTKSQKKVADYIIKNPMQAAFSTVDQLAHSVGTSTTTIVRLALFLGFSGYAEFQKDLQELLKSRTGPSTKLEVSFKDANVKSNVLKGIAQQQSENFNRTFDNLSDGLVFKTEKMLSEANHIYVAGFRSCFSVAHYLCYNLNRIFGNCDLMAAEGGEVPEKVHRVTAKDVVIVISLPRYIKEIVAISEVAKSRNASIIAITDGFLSPLAEKADALYSVECKSSDFHNSISSAMLVAEVLIGVCTMKNPQRVKQQLYETEQVLQTFNVHVNR